MLIHLRCPLETADRKKATASPIRRNRMPNSARTAPCKNTLAPFAQGETVEHNLPQQRANSHQIHRNPRSGIVPNRIIIVASSGREASPIGPSCFSFRPLQQPNRQGVWVVGDSPTSKLEPGITPTVAVSHTSSANRSRPLNLRRFKRSNSGPQLSIVLGDKSWHFFEA